MDHPCVTSPSPRDGIVLWELLEQKCQQRVCQHTDVVQTRQAGWMVLILQWKMVKLKGRPALVIALLVAKTQNKFLLKTVDPTLSTNFIRHLGANYVTVVRTECKAKNSRNKRTNKLILRYTYLRDFVCSSFYDNHLFLLQILYANDVLLTCNEKCLNCTFYKASLSL